MKKIFLLSVIFIGFISKIKAQQISEEEKNLYYEFAYFLTKDIFTEPKKYNYKTKKYNETEVFPKIDYTEKDLSIVTDSLQKFAKIEFDFDRENVYLKSKFPSFFHPETDFSSQVIDIEVLESNLINNKNSKINLVKGGGSGFGFSFFYQNINDKEINKNFITVNRQSQVENDDQFIASIKGSITYLVKYIVGYDKIELSSQDKGKTFILNNDEYTLIEVKNNRVLLAPKSKNRNQKLKIIVFHKNKKDILVEKPLTEMDDISDAIAISQGSINEDIYQVFKENPDITLEEFKRKINIEKLIHDEIKYLYISTPFPIEEKFIIYTPIFITKEIKVNVK